MSYAPSDVPPTLVWRPGSGLSGPMVYDDFVELAAACASNPTVIEVQCDGLLLPTLPSPDGSRWEILVGDDGSLTTRAIKT
jgi:hypothetical protein